MALRVGGVGGCLSCDCTRLPEEATVLLDEDLYTNCWPVVAARRWSELTDSPLLGELVTECPPLCLEESIDAHMLTGLVDFDLPLSPALSDPPLCVGGGGAARLGRGDPGTLELMLPADAVWVT